MPSNLPSTFASAAAGQNPARDGRGRGNAAGDWSRRDGRSANGTLTFRRSSTTPIGHPSQQNASSESPVPTPSTEAAPAQPLIEESGPSRYSKVDLLSMYRPQAPAADPSRLFYSTWDPSHANGYARGWSKNESHVPQEPGLCWDENGGSTPLGLQDMSVDEREAFSTDINSTVKHSTHPKEGHSAGVNGRKPSVSGNAYGIGSPTSAKSGTRRRETTDANPLAASSSASPTAPGRFSRDDSPFWLPRRSTEIKDTEGDAAESDQSSRDAHTRPPFGGLLRSNVSASAGVGSVWPPSGQNTSGAGAFGSFALSTSSAVGDRRVGGASGGSRLAHLMPKEGSEGATGKGSEASNALAQQSWRSRPRTDTDPFGEEGLAGSAALGGALDTTSGPLQSSRAGTLGTPVKGPTEDFGLSGLNLGSQRDSDAPPSPSGTNPYRSPPTERHDHVDTDPVAGDKPPSIATSLEQAPGFGSVHRGFGVSPLDGSDRSQTSSAGAKAHPLGAMSGWPAAGTSTGTPDRERPNFGSAFGSSLFSPIADLQSPGLAGFSNAFGPASAGAIGGSVGRGSKLGSLFPPAMQAQMQNHDHDNNLADSLPDVQQSSSLGAIGRNTFQIPPRNSDSPMRQSRGVFEELFPSSDASRSHGLYGSAEASQTPGSSGVPGPQSFTPVSGSMGFGGGPQSGNEPPPAQVRQMVMPDRMRWVYLDPQGQVQGPFTGLEMNDWYKAQFFTPDLRVKKVEDAEFEPLGQLIRRIGNSREPFLVPQIGVAHGPPSQSGPFPTPSSGAGVVPPLSGVFPSFGRTLTAEEQNNLERRKQEEQFMMAQQREYLMRQQHMSRVQLPGQGLHHHPSANSLQSQPSFGSMNSPAVGPPQQQDHPSAGVMPPTPGYFGPAVSGPAAGPRPGSGSREVFREQDAVHPPAQDRAPPQEPGDMSLHSGWTRAEQLGEDPEGFRERLKQFEDLRAQHDAEQARYQDKQEDPRAEAVEPTPEREDSGALAAKHARTSRKKAAAAEDGLLSLTQQVQQTQAAAALVQNPVEPEMPMPFPPPSSSTPLPAPTAQRARSNLPEQYNRDQTDSPETSASSNAQPPPLAPWAKDSAHESQRGPSLKEIQEAEARKAARAEEAAAAARKAAMEQEAVILKEKEKAAAAAAGLPPSSTWAHGSPVSAGTPWAKPPAAKAPAPGLSAAAASGGKKTLADIQREEELRKQKLKEAAGQAGVPAGVARGYANLAGKPGHAGPGGAAQSTSPSLAQGGGGWATVGAGGKVKIPTGPATQARAASGSNVRSVTAPPKPAARSAAANSKPDGNRALDEFNKWVHRELSRGIIGVNDIASFQATLDVLPLDMGIIADAVYANSTTMDGRHFAAEFVRRKKLAEKGIVEKQPPATDSKDAASGSGWSEVAKKGSGASGPAKDSDSNTQAAGFKVVPSRKKGKK